jgi:hypothetical protein
LVVKKFPDINLESISPEDAVSTTRTRISGGTHPDFQTDFGTADPIPFGGMSLSETAVLFGFARRRVL